MEGNAQAAAGDQPGPVNHRYAIAHFQPPPFWTTAVPIWFHRLESGFRVKGILDDTDRYDIVVNTLENSVLTHVTDLLNNPPATNKYETLKARLIDAFVDSEDKQLQRLLKETVLGDKRPTHLLREMRELAANKVSEDLLKTLWLQQMPPNVRTVLAVSGDQSLNALSALADKIMELCPNKTVCETSHAPTPAPVPSVDPLYSSLLEKIDSLTKQVEALSTRGRRENRGRGRSQSRSRSRSRPRPAHPDYKDSKIAAGTWKCHYHFRYGENAIRCESPCCYRKKKPENK